MFKILSKLDIVNHENLFGIQSNTGTRTNCIGLKTKGSNTNLAAGSVAYKDHWWKIYIFIYLFNFQLMYFKEEKGKLEHHILKRNTLSKFRKRRHDMVSNVVILVEGIDEAAGISKECNITYYVVITFTKPVETDTMVM